MSFLGVLLKPLAYLSVPIIIAAWFTPVGYYYIRLGIYIALLSGVGTASSFIALAMTPAGRKYDVNSVVANTFYWIASRTLNITVEVEGEEHLQTRPGVMIANHQSILDILWLGRYVVHFFRKIQISVSEEPPLLSVVDSDMIIDAGGFAADPLIPFVRF